MTSDEASAGSSTGADELERLVCIELVELVTEYFEGTLPERDRARFERHLEVCSPCVAYVDQMRQTVAAAGRLSPDEIPPEGRDRLLALYRSYRGR